MMHPTSVDSVEDMAALGDLHEAAILYNIYQRYMSDKIYVRYIQRDMERGGGGEGERVEREGEKGGRRG